MSRPDQTIDSGLPSVFADGKLYDLVLGDSPYGLEFYLDLARGAGGPVLEVACGTGRILLACLQEGVDIEGLDAFEPMLATLRSKGAALGLSPTLHLADMSDFHLVRRFALVMIPFNAFIHNMTQEAQIRCLRRCREHLLPGGRLAFDTFFPSLEIVGAAQGTRVLEAELARPESGQTVRLYDTRQFDRVEQTQYSLIEIELRHDDGSPPTVSRAQISSRYVYKHEMALLLRAAGFARWELHGDFAGRPLACEADAMVVTAWRD